MVSIQLSNTLNIAEQSEPPLLDSGLSKFLFGRLYKKKMPGTLTYPMYAGVENHPQRQRSHTWSAQRRRSVALARPGRLSLVEPPLVNEADLKKLFLLTC